MERKIKAYAAREPRGKNELESVAGKFDFIISTVNADLNWLAFLNTLAPKGRLHFCDFTD
jgi:uncharacterized zinc-type alcohol dehydrogenase-like protein